MTFCLWSILFSVTGRLRWSSASKGQGRPLLLGGNHQLGHRLRWGQPARRLHTDIQVCTVDPADRHLEASRWRRQRSRSSSLVEQLHHGQQATNRQLQRTEQLLRWWSDQIMNEQSVCQCDSSGSQVTLFILKITQEIECGTEGS